MNIIVYMVIKKTGGVPSSSIEKGGAKSVDANIKKLIALAEQEIGYLEKRTNDQLDDKTANAGSNNYTKYGRDMQKWIGSPFTNGAAWCQTFCQYLFVTCFGPIITRFPFSISVPVEITEFLP